MRRHLDYGSVVGTLALALSLGGVSYAAVSLPHNSVGSAQLRNGSVTAAKVPPGSLRAGNFVPVVQGDAAAAIDVQPDGRIYVRGTPGATAPRLSLGETTFRGT